MQLHQLDDHRWELRYCFWKTSGASFAFGLSFVLPLCKCAANAANLPAHQCLGALIGVSVCLVVAGSCFEMGRCLVDRDKGQLLLERRNLFRRCRQTYDLAHVMAFRLEQNPRLNSAGCRIAVQFHDGETPMPVHQVYLGQGQSRLQDVTERLNALLAVT